MIIGFLGVYIGGLGFFFQAEDGIRDLVRSRGLGDVYKRQVVRPGDVVVRIDPRYFRPTEVDTLLGNPGKAKEKLGWEARISFEDMISEMVEHDLADARRDILCLNSGFRVLEGRE